MRLFIAVELTENAKEILARNVSSLKNYFTEKLNWVDNKKWHLTLKFLGETEKNQVKNITNILDNVAGNYREFSMAFSGINAFPDMNYPQVIYMPVTKGTAIAKKMNSELEAEMKKIGFKKSRNKYIPHITVARTRKSNNQKRIGRELEYFLDKKDNRLQTAKMSVNELTLIKSTLKSSGAVYDIVFKTSLSSGK